MIFTIEWGADEQKACGQEDSRRTRKQIYNTMTLPSAWSCVSGELLPSITWSRNFRLDVCEGDTKAVDSSYHFSA